MNAMKKYYIAMAILAGISLIAVIWQYAITRGTVQDQQKVQDIITLQDAVQRYATDKSKAPDNLNQLTLKDDLEERLGNYTYTTEDSRYTICASFKTDTSQNGTSYESASPYAHKTGRQCFTDTITTFLDDYNSDSYDRYLDDFNNSYSN